MNGQIQCTRCEPSQGDDDGLVNQKEWYTDIKVMTSLADQIEITGVTDQVDITSVTGKANITNSDTNMRDITNILDIYQYTLLLH